MVTTVDTQSNQRFWCTSKNLVVGMGPRPYLPEFVSALDTDKIFHSSKYLFKRETLHNKKVVVVGGGQSGLEILLDLMKSDISPASLSLLDKQPFIAQTEDSPFAENIVFSQTGLTSFIILNPEKSH